MWASALVLTLSGRIIAGLRFHIFWPFPGYDHCRIDAALEVDGLPIPPKYSFTCLRDLSQRRTTALCYVGGKCIRILPRWTCKLYGGSGWVIDSMCLILYANEIAGQSIGACLQTWMATQSLWPPRHCSLDWQCHFTCCCLSFRRSPDLLSL